MHKSDELNGIILQHFPTPIAVLYKKMLTEDNWHVKTDTALQIFEEWMKSMTLQMVVQYLDQDIHIFQNNAVEKLNAALKEKFFKPSLGSIIEIFFHLLDAYRKQMDRLFLPELHGIMWRTTEGKSKIKKYRDSFNRLVSIRNDIAHGEDKPVDDKGWQEKYQETENLLLAVLERFKFFEDYRIVYGLEIQGQVFSCLQLQGMKPNTIEISLSEGDDVSAGKIYLDNRTDIGGFYELHPLFLPWPSGLFGIDHPDEDNDDISLAVYHKATYSKYEENATKVRYSVADKDTGKISLQDDVALEQFLKLIRVLADLRSQKQEVEHLNWDFFEDIADQITWIETESIRDKFSPDLYLQRNHIKIAFDHFLESKKAAFVLLGKSGVGKSNFVLAMQAALSETPEAYMLIINSAGMSNDGNLTSSLTKMLSNKLKLKNDGGFRKIDNIFAELDQINKIAEKRIVLAFDGINENEAPHKLIRRIDDFIKQNEYPWLKVLLTSRPEAWQAIQRKKRIITVSKYFRQSDTQALGNELAGIDVQAEGSEGWLALDSFQQVELPKAYHLYKEKYDLKTEFNTLSPEMRTLLKDPLALRLVAETYGSDDETISKPGVLPKSVQTSKLYELYIDSLIEDGRLDRLDVSMFLEQQLLPLMFQDGEYHNKLDAQILDDTKDPSSGKPLSEKIELDDWIESSGKHVNQSFQNLADADILVKQGTYSDYEISFKYERFYDYFGGKYLFENAPVRLERIQWYCDLIKGISEKPFLWGPIRQTLFLDLVKEGQQSNFQIVSQLLELKIYFIRELLESVLTWYVKDFPEQGLKLLENLYGNRRSTYRKMAVRVAGFAGIPEILALGGADRDKNVRFANIQSTYFYWQKEPANGWEILESWSESVRGRFFIPNISIAESALGLTFLIMTDRSNSSKPELEIPDYQNPEIAKRLQKIWRTILSDLLFISEKETQQSTLRTRIRSLILTLLINSILPFMSGSSKTTDVRTAATIPQISSMFKIDPAKRNKFLELRPYWDPSDKGLEEIEDLLIECFDPANPISVGAVVLLVQLRAKRDGDQNLGVVEKIYNRYFDPKYPTMAPAQLVFNSGYILRRDPAPPSDEAWEIYTRLQKSYLDVGGMYYTSEKEIHECSYMELYASLAQHQNKADQVPSLLLENVRNSVEQYRKTGELLPPPGSGHAPSIPATIFMFGNLGIVYKNAALALEATKPIITMLVEDAPQDDEKDPKYDKILEQMGKMLARFRLYYRDQVDNLLEDANAPERLKHIVQTTVIEEDLWGDYLAYRFGPFGIRTIFVTQVRELMWKIFELSLEKNNLGAWLNHSLRLVINFVYGAKVFPVD